jgi:hypothetical protein
MCFEKQRNGNLACSKMTSRRKPRGGNDPRIVTELADGNQERQLERTMKA